MGFIKNKKNESDIIQSCLAVPKFFSILIAVFLLLSSVLFVSCTEKGRSLVDQADLDGKDFVCLKEGYYCGEGICEANHGTGYLYFTEEFTKEEAMEQADFEKDEDGKYTNGHEFAEIVGVSAYKEGYILEYRITGHV